jgi:hypothetical protein
MSKNSSDLNYGTPKKYKDGRKRWTKNYRK